MTTKEYKKASAQPLIELQKRTGMKNSEIAEVIGCSATAISRWIQDGAMPAMMTLAVEALYKRKTTPDEEIVVVSVVSGGRVVDSRAVSSPNRLNLNRQSYMLIPVTKG